MAAGKAMKNKPAFKFFKILCWMWRKLDAN